MFEEKCHPDKEEHLFFGESESDSIRMLGSFVGRKKDNQKRLKRAAISAKSSWNAHTVLRVFYPRPISLSLLRV